MRVFALTTGRSGSTTFARSFAHATNFSVDHEAVPISEPFGPITVDFRDLVYPDNHISSDSRIVWAMGLLHETYPDSLYVHLIRDRDAVAESFDRRRFDPAEAPGAWRFGTHLFGDDTDCREGAARMWDVVNANIRDFLTDKPHMTVWIEDLSASMIELWRWIGAEGDLHAAIEDAAVRHNQSMSMVAA